MLALQCFRIPPGFPESYTIPKLSRIPAFAMLSRTYKPNAQSRSHLTESSAHIRGHPRKLSEQRKYMASSTIFNTRELRNQDSCRIRNQDACGLDCGDSTGRGDRGFGRLAKQGSGNWGYRGLDNHSRGLRKQDSRGLNSRSSREGAGGSSGNSLPSRHGLWFCSSSSTSPCKGSSKGSLRGSSTASVSPPFLVSSTCLRTPKVSPRLRFAPNSNGVIWALFLMVVSAPFLRRCSTISV